MRMLRCLLLFWLSISCIASPAQAAVGDALNREGLVATFSDEFDRFDPYIEQGEDKGTGIWRTNFGYRWAALNDVKNHSLIWNNEEQLYVDPSFEGTGNTPLGLSALKVESGVLTITASRAPDIKALSGYHYLSGLITSEPRFTQTYGVFEMRAKLPKGKGLWPAFWLLPASKEWPPEIDVMEVLGDRVTQYHTTLHSKADGKPVMSSIAPHPVPDLSAEFHTYGVEWGEKEIVFYFDDHEIARTPTPADMHQPFYMLANLAVGGKWPGSPDASTVFPAVMQIEWIRAWRR